MQYYSSSLFRRPDTLFGVCQAIGDDFGFSPVYLRLSLAALVLWNPVAMLALYAALGFAVAVSRWLVPAPRRPVAASLAPASAGSLANDVTPAPLAIAA